VVIELGENAHMERRDKPDADIQETHVASAVRARVPLARRDQLIITHGNGPQVAVLARIRLTIRACPSPPVRSPGRQTQGMIGYWLLQALVAALPGTRTCCLLRRTAIAHLHLRVAGSPATVSGRGA